MDRHALLLLALTGCVIVTDDDKEDTAIDTDGTTTDTGDTVTTPGTGDTGGTNDPDADEDGFPASVDCNDFNANINPEAEEICDGLDNNCDSAIDDGAAATLEDTNYATLDDAIAAAVNPGSVIQLCPGDHTVTGFAVGDKAELTLLGVAGRDLTSLSEASNLSVATVNGTGMLTLDGLTITGALDVPALVAEDNAALTVLNSTISGNTGSGIDASGGTSGTLTLYVEGTTIEGNAALEGGGIRAFNGFDLVIVDSTISGNTAERGGGLWARSLFLPAFVTLEGTTIDGNTANTGGGVYSSAVPIVADGASFVTNNVGLVDAGGLALYHASVSSVLVSGNNAVRGGGIGILRDSDLAGLGPVDLVAVIVDSNSADEAGGVLVEDTQEVYVDAYSAVTLNSATSLGGGALVTQLGSLSSQGADWGDYYGGENTPHDVFSGANYNYDGAATFTCNGASGCMK